MMALQDSFGIKKALDGYNNITGLRDLNGQSVEIYGGITVFMLEIAGILAIFMVVWSGYKYLTAYGSEEKAASAKKSFIYALLGLAVSLSALFIISLLAGLPTSK